jgi:transcriptional regulator with XRE-family HTH domain
MRTKGNGCEEVARFIDQYDDERIIHKTKNGLSVRRRTVTPGIAMSGPVGVLVGAKIRARRLAVGMSQTELAVRCGMYANPKHRIHSIEKPAKNRSKGIQLGTLYTIAAALKCSPCDLLPSLQEAMRAAGVERNHSSITRIMLKANGRTLP